MKKLMACILVLFLLVGCGQRVPEPESIVAEAADDIDQSNIRFRHIVDGDLLKIECIMPNISLANGDSNRASAKIRLFVNGKFYKDYDTAAFIVKNLQKGKHQIKIDVVRSDNNQSLGVTNEFTVVIR